MYDAWYYSARGHWMAQQALVEMWCVSRNVVILGLLNRHSLLYYMKRNSKGYLGVRWDTLSQVRKWSDNLLPAADN